jgi:hypothetical protein
MISKLTCICVFLPCVLTAAVSRAATIALPANGNLQAAINNALPGDVITLPAGAIYVGNFILPAKTNPNGLPITIKSAANPVMLPAAGQRILPGHSVLLPKIKSPNVEPALQTAANARFWVLQYLEFQATDRGYGDIITLGSGDPAVQRDVTQVPRDLTIDHCYIHGDPIFGQKRGIALNSGKTDIIDSYVSDIKATGIETQAIAGWNGPGPYRILNNYLEGAGINFLIGGADPGIANLVTDTIEFKRNHLAKPTAWRQSILATPTNVNVTIATAGSGTLSGTVYYTIVAAGTAAMDTPVFSLPTTEMSVQMKGRGSVTLTWNPVAGATRYRIYRNTKPGTRTDYLEATSPSFVDVGSKQMLSGAIPGAAKWTVKNLFELKNARNVVVDGNLMEYCWTDAQNGYAVLFTPRNSDGGAPWTRVENVTFTNNIVRHAPGGINILGRDYIYPSEQTKNIVIRNNLFDDLTSNWGDNLAWLLLGNGADGVTADHNTIVHAGASLVLAYALPTTNFVYTHNMGRNNDYGFIGDSRAPGKDSINFYLPGSAFSKNILAGGNGAIYPDTNLQCGVGGETCYPTTSQWQAQFNNFSEGDYRLLTTSPYARAGAGGTDLGANIEAIKLAVPGSNLR